MQQRMTNEQIRNIATSIEEAMNLARKDEAEKQSIDKELAGKCFDAGAEHEYRKHFGAVPNPAPDKEIFINSLNLDNAQIRDGEDWEDGEPEFQRCSDCDGHDACEDFGCAIKAGIIEPSL